MRFYSTKIAKKNGVNRSSPFQHPPALSATATSRPSSVNSATGSKETAAFVGNTRGLFVSNTRGTVDCHPRRC